jgi:hypothetical protein
MTNTILSVRRRLVDAAGWFYAFGIIILTSGSNRPSSVIGILDYRIYPVFGPEVLLYANITVSNTNSFF